MDLPVKTEISLKVGLSFGCEHKIKTHTRDNNDDTSADTPEVMMIARARLEPVPPPGGPFMIMQARQLRIGRTANSAQAPQLILKQWLGRGP